MKFQLTSADLLENHHLYGLIHTFMRENDGREPSYLIFHPETMYRIQADISAREEFQFQVIRYNFEKEKQNVTMYGINCIRSYDVEEGFIEIV